MKIGDRMFAQTLIDETEEAMFVVGVRRKVAVVSRFEGGVVNEDELSLNAAIVLAKNEGCSAEAELKIDGLAKAEGRVDRRFVVEASARGVVDQIFGLEAIEGAEIKEADVEDATSDLIGRVNEATLVP